MDSNLWAAVDGQVTPAEAASVPALDRGFLFGEAVYEVFVARDGQPEHWAEHFARLQASAQAVGFAVPSGLSDTLQADVAAVCAALGAPEAYVRLLVTRGAHGLDPTPGITEALRRVVVARALAPLPADLRDHGCVLWPVPAPPHAAGAPVAKRTARPEAAAERAAAAAHGAYEALRVDGAGRALECTTANFFAVVDGALRTASLAEGVLAGVTRGRVLALAAEARVPAWEAAPTLAEVARASEAFITSSTRGLVPVRAVGDAALPAPGPVTRALAAAYATSAPKEAS